MAAVPPAQAPVPAKTDTDLNTFSTGVIGTKFKKGDNWIYNPDIFTLDTLRIDKAKRLAGVPFYFDDITYTDYKLQELQDAQFPQTTLETLDTVFKFQEKARIFGKSDADVSSKKAEFQKAVDAHRTAQLKPKLAAKKASNQAEWNKMTAGISADTKAELDGLTQEYIKKKAELEKQLEAAFKAQTKQLVINKQWNTQDQYAQYLESQRLVKPGVKKPDGPKGPIALSDALDAAGRPIINSIKVGQTRKRHRFIHLLVKPGTQADSSKPVAKPAEWYSNDDGNSQPQFPLEYSSDDENQSAAYKPMDPITIPRPGEGQPPSPSETPPGSPLGSPTPTPTPHGGKRKTKRKPRRR